MAAGKSICFRWNTRFTYFFSPTIVVCFPNGHLGKLGLSISIISEVLVEGKAIPSPATTKRRISVAFCHTCAIAVIGKKIQAATAEALFVSDWKIAFSWAFSPLRFFQLSIQSISAGIIRLYCYRLPDIPYQIVTKLKSMGITGLLKHHKLQYKWHLTMQKSLVSYMMATHSYI